MNQRRLYKVFIWGFLLLYLMVAAISFFHAIQFFSVGNNITMSVVLAFAFEVGLALSLAAVLLSDANKRATLPWILMIVLTAVQVIGNVYSTYKYMALSDVEYYQYLAKPLLFWMEGVTEDSVQIVVSWIIGAILPIIALFMTDMVATNIKNLNSGNTEKSEAELQKETETVEEKPEPVKEEEIPSMSHERQDSDGLVESLKDAFKPTFNEKAVEPAPVEESVPNDEKKVDNEVFPDSAVSEAEVTTEKQGRLKKWAKKLMQNLKSDE